MSATMNTLGFFSEPSYITIGDPYASTEGARLHSSSGSAAPGTVSGVLLSTVLLRRAGKGAEGKTARLSRYYGKQFGVAPPKKGQVRPPAAPPDQLVLRSSAETPAAWAQVAKDVYFDDFKRLYEVRARSPQTAAAPPRLGLTVRALHRARSTSTPGRSRLSRRSPTTQARSAATGSRTARPRRSALPPRLTPPKPCP